MQRAFYPPGFAFHYHSHDFREMAVVVGGSGRHLRDDGADRIASGDVIFIAPACRHHLAAGREALVFLNLTCRPTAWRRYARHLRALPGWEGEDGCGIWRSVGDDRRWLVERLERWERLGGALDETGLAALLIECAERHRWSARPTEARLPAPLRRLQDLLSQSDRFDLAPDDLARAAGCSREHLGRLARQHLGRSLGQLLEERRLDHAAALLLRSDQPIAAIAAASGHGNLGHFYERFRARFGCPPGAYRSRAHRSPV